MKVDAITLAVEDRAKQFYGDGLGCQGVQDQPQFVAISLAKVSSGLSLYPRRALAHDAGVDAQGSGFAGFTFNYFVAAEQEVDEVLGRAEKAGGAIVGPVQQAQWGGYCGYFADLDGYLY